MEKFINACQFASITLPARHAIWKKWEMHWVQHTQTGLSLFDVSDPGRSGMVQGAEVFLATLEKTMEADLGYSVDLRANHNRAVGEGNMTRSVSPEAQVQIKRFQRSR